MLVVVTALTVTYVFGSDSLDRLSQTGVDVRFEATRAGKVDEVTRFIKSIERATAQLAASPMTVEATTRFTQAYGNLPTTKSESSRRTAIDTLVPIYRDEYLPSLVEARGRQVELASVIPATDEAIYLQTAYFGAAATIGVGPEDIDDALDGSDWTAVHQEFNPTYRETADELGLSDVYIIDAATDAIVYSVAKNTDFATSLELGPVSGSTLATMVRLIRQSPEAGMIAVVDFARYNPDLAAPMAFFGSPIFDGDRFIGVLATKISTNETNRIMTNDADWPSIGLGQTGEAFIVGSDGRFRSDSRLFVENPDAYFEEAIEAGTLDSGDVSGVLSSGTTALFQRMDLATLEAVQKVDGDVVETTSYLAKPAFTTVEEVDIDGLDWLVVVQAARNEVDGLRGGAGTATGVTIVMFVLILTFVAVVWASRFVRPVRALTLRLRSLTRHEDRAPASSTTVQDGAVTREYAELADGIESMIDGLAERERILDETETERRELIRRFLPAEVVRRLEAGERDLVERIPNATVVAIVLGGLGTLREDDSIADIRSRLDASIETFDDIAGRYGLDRVKIIGDTYYAVCGLTRPYLDHAPRSIEFAIEALRTFDWSDTDVERLDLSIGVASGPITAGLAGRHHLLFDTWGVTVTEAGFLARAARPGTIVVSPSVRNQLPDDIEAIEFADAPEALEAWQIVPARDAEDAPT